MNSTLLRCNTRLKKRISFWDCFTGWAALIGSMAWGCVAFLIRYIFLYGAIVIGLFVGKAGVQGMGRVTWPGRILIGVHTRIEIIENAHTSLWSGLHIAVANFWKIETDSGSGVLSIIFGLIGAAIVVYSTRKPEFKARFEPLGVPTSSGSSTAGAF